MAPETTFVCSAKRTSNTKKPKAEKRIRRRRRPRCTFCGRPVMCGQGASHYECRPRCVNCGQPKGICLPSCPSPSSDGSIYPAVRRKEVGDRDDYDLAT
jgi:hypothetical protein